MTPFCKSILNNNIYEGKNLLVIDEVNYSFRLLKSEQIAIVLNEFFTLMIGLIVKIISHVNIEKLWNNNQSSFRVNSHFSNHIAIRKTSQLLIKLIRFKYDQVRH